MQIFARRLTRRALRGVFATGLVLSSSVVGGCFAEGGLWWSEDQFVYSSRPYQPWTVNLRDTRTGQSFWSIDVPVGQQLVVHFVEGGGTPGSFTPDKMEWDLMKDGEYFKNLTSSLPVPAAAGRRLDPVLRAVPELPPSMVAAGVQPPVVERPAPPPKPEPVIQEPLSGTPVDPTAPPIDLPPK